jgi:hypothetical protein
VADSVPGRIGDVLVVQDLPSGAGASAGLVRDTLARAWGAATARRVDPSAPPQAGEPRKLIVFYYANERRGGEVITGGTAALWDGENVAPIAEINLGTTTRGVGTSQPEVTRPPFRPITESHVAVARALHGHDPVCAASDWRAQARLLRARDSRASTISVVNRYDDDIDFVLDARHNGRAVRVPPVGTIRLPAGEAILLPLEYELAPRLIVRFATVQLIDAVVERQQLRLLVRSFGGGVVNLRLPGRLTDASVDGRAAHVSARASIVAVSVPSGERELQVRWRHTQRTYNHSSAPMV